MAQWLFWLVNLQKCVKKELAKKITLVIMESCFGQETAVGFWIYRTRRRLIEAGLSVTMIVSKLDARGFKVGRCGSLRIFQVATPVFLDKRG
jgi:hypothetical protein